jgi:hypothetical protein
MIKTKRRLTTGRSEIHSVDVQVINCKEGRVGGTDDQALIVDQIGASEAVDLNS